MFTVQDLLKMFGDFLINRKQGKELMERMTRLLRMGEEETKAVLTLCDWSAESFKKLLEVLIKYETYQTKDVGEGKMGSVHLSEGKMSRGERLRMTNRLLKRLSKVTPEYFVDAAEDIKQGKVSLEATANMFEQDKARVKVVRLMEVGVNIQQIES